MPGNAELQLGLDPEMIRKPESQDQNLSWFHRFLLNPFHGVRISLRSRLLLKKVRLANKRELPSLCLYFTWVLAEFSAALRIHPNGEISR